MFKLFDLLTSIPRRLFQGLLLAFLVVAVPVRALYYQVRLWFGTDVYTAPDASGNFDVVCFSHVPWSHIWQRNHHTMTRLAKGRKVIYFQTTSIAYMHWFVRHWPHSREEFENSWPGLTLRYPLLFPGQSRVGLIRMINRWLLLTEKRWLIKEQGLQNVVLWFYYPSCAYVLDKFKPAAVVYDIQDEYTAFEWSPRDIAQNERYLLDRADIIFGGTHALYERKKEGFRGEAYFYPCAVEFSHFFSAAPAFSDEYFAKHPEVSAEARETLLRITREFHASGEEYGTVSVPDAKLAGATDSNDGYAKARVSSRYQGGAANYLAEPAELAKYRRPRLLYVGLIDKRIDPDLLAHLGQAHPDWEIIMVGPVDDRLFDQASVEQAAPNVRFVGSVKYRWLPNFLAYCDVYLMPWKVNDLTRHINPTKTLEYMAAGRPVVSIALPDLVNLFSDSVNLAETPEQFVAECEAALAGQRWDKVANGMERAWGFAWNAVVQEMVDHVQVAVDRNLGIARANSNQGE